MAVESQEFLVDLPLSLKSFSHRGWGMYNPDKPSPDKPASASLSKNLSSVAKHLEAVVLLDTRHSLTRCLAPRGVFDKLVKKISAVKTLSINPTAVSHLSDLLAPLAHLEELELVQGESIALAPLSYQETVLFVTRSKRLRRLVVSQEIRANWSRQQAEHVEHEAGRKGCVVEWPVRIR